MCDNENHYIDIIKHSSENKNVEFLERCTEMAINMAAKGNLSDAIKLVSNIFPLLLVSSTSSTFSSFLLKKLKFKTFLETDINLFLEMVTKSFV